MEVAEPVAVIAGVTPVTNPTSTTLLNQLFLQKQEILLFLLFTHRPENALQKLQELLEMQRLMAAPINCIQWVEHLLLKLPNI